MTDTKENKQNSQQAADGVFEEKHGNTTYKVKVYFNHDGEEITREQYAIYCNYHRSCGIQTDPVLNKKVY